MITIIRQNAAVWIALVTLALLSCALAYVPLGVGNLIAALMIAGVKMTLIAVFFMHLRQAPPALRLVALAPVLFLSFLLVLSFADVLMRLGIERSG